MPDTREDRDLTLLYRRWGKIGPNEVIKREYDEPEADDSDTTNAGQQ